MKRIDNEQHRIRADDLITEIMKLKTVDIEYCPHGYDEYICREDVINIILKLKENEDYEIH